jgi:hypothetical protein
MIGAIGRHPSKPTAIRAGIRIGGGGQPVKPVIAIGRPMAVRIDQARQRTVRRVATLLQRSRLNRQVRPADQSAQRVIAIGGRPVQWIRHTGQTLDRIIGSALRGRWRRVAVATLPPSGPVSPASDAEPTIAGEMAETLRQIQAYGPHGKAVRALSAMLPPCVKRPTLWDTHTA